jgi:DNA-binding GntR family transcriptional regulator
LSSLAHGRTTTKSGAAYEALFRAIITSEIKPNEALDEAELCARFEFGRTPIREAVKRLALEGVVTWPERRSPYVRAIDAMEQDRLDEARTTLEISTAAFAADRATPRQIEALYQECDELERLFKARDTYAGVMSAYRFHQRVAEAADNRFLADAVRTLNMSTLRQWYSALSTQDTSNVAIDHRAIADAIARHDRVLVIEMMTSDMHTSRARQELLRAAEPPRAH